MSSKLPVAVLVAGCAIAAAPAPLNAANRCSFTGFKPPPLTPIVGGVTAPETTPATPPVVSPAAPPAEPPASPPTQTTAVPPAPAPATPPAPKSTVDGSPSGTRSVGAPSVPASATPPVPTSLSPGFAYYPPGDLLPQDADRARKGDRRVYLRNIVFPMKLGDGIHPHMNSQIWGHGGYGWGKTKGPGGTECDAVNYDPLIQRDNYCEVRDNDSTHAMPLCPKGYGHQGQDIRPPACPPPLKWQAVAVADGTITQVTAFSYLTLQGKDGTVYAYLHMDPKSVTVTKGAKVKQGDVLGLVSNVMDREAGGTTYHLHFQARQTIKVGSRTLSVYVPVYASLIAALRRAKGLEHGVDAKGDLIVDPNLEIRDVAVAAPSPSPSPASIPLPPAAEAPPPASSQPPPASSEQKPAQ